MDEYEGESDRSSTYLNNRDNKKGPKERLCKCCDDKIKGKFGLAWIADYPNCTYSEPLGWQVEFTGTATEVAAKCNQIISWVNAPPLENNERTELEDENQYRQSTSNKDDSYEYEEEYQNRKSTSDKYNNSEYEGENRRRKSSTNRESDNKSPCKCNTNNYNNNPYDQELYANNYGGNYQNNNTNYMRGCCCPKCNQVNNVCTKCKTCTVNPSYEAFKICYQPPDIIKLCPPRNQNNPCSCNCPSNNYSYIKSVNCDPKCPQATPKNPKSESETEDFTPQTKEIEEDRGPSKSESHSDSEKSVRHSKSSVKKMETPEESIVTIINLPDATSAYESANDIEIVSLK